jgi:hydrogenase maturation factor
MAIVTGHTGTYPGLSTIVGVCTAYGTIDRERLKTPGNARSGDYLYCIKPIGMETVINFALTQRNLAEELFGLQETRKLSKLVYTQSCVKEALLLAELEGVHAMHDATEGGVVAALNEIAEASDVGFKIHAGKLPIPERVRTLQKYLRLSEEQVLSMSSTGTILAAVSPEAKNKAERTLKRGKVEAHLVGILTSNVDRIIESNGKEKAFPLKADDPYARILSGET